MTGQTETEDLGECVICGSPRTFVDSEYCPVCIAKRDCQRAFARGVRDYEGDYGSEDNPYGRDNDRARAWLEGFEYADDRYLKGLTSQDQP